METSPASQLPTFRVERFHIDEPKGSYDMLEVTCPRPGCGLAHWVVGGWTGIQPVEGRPEDPPAKVFGRACPYCFRASAVPPELRTKKTTIKRRKK